MVPPMFTRYFALCVLLSMPLRQFPEDATQIFSDKRSEERLPKDRRSYGNGMRAGLAVRYDGVS